MRALKRDDTEKLIVMALRMAGCKVIKLKEWDLMVLRGGNIWMLECKTGRGRLTPSQEKLLLDGWPLKIVKSPQEALRAVGL